MQPPIHGAWFQEGVTTEKNGASLIGSIVRGGGSFLERVAVRIGLAEGRRRGHMAPEKEPDFARPARQAQQPPCIGELAAFDSPARGFFAEPLRGGVGSLLDGEAQVLRYDA